MAGRAGEAVWVEKYRPTSLKEMTGQEAILPLLRSYAEKRSMPHLLFAGPPGTGKTTAALALAREMFGPDWRQNFLELNASVTGDTSIQIRTDGRVYQTTMSDLADEHLRASGTDVAPTPGLEVLSVSRDLHVGFQAVASMSRHRVAEVARISFEGGSVGTSLHHSVIVLDDGGRLRPHPVSEMRPGDHLLSFKTRPADDRGGRVRSARGSLGEASRRERAAVGRLRTAATSELRPVKILSISVRESDEPLYDLSVPTSQMFFGGTVPVLLHNSDERGIDTVRTTIKTYARTSPLGDVGFKILFLDEADNLTAEAQGSLRRMMERYSGSCRFILSCNYSSRIIDPIQSRCAVFRFRSYRPEAIRLQLERVAKGEGKKISPDAMETILTVSSGDMRRATNLLQLAGTHTDSITAESIREYATAPLRREVEGMLGSALAGNFGEARNRLYSLLTDRGASGEEILKAIHGYLPEIPESVLPAREKVRLVEYLGEVDFRLAQGATDRIQLEAVLAHLATGDARPK